MSRAGIVLGCMMALAACADDSRRVRDFDSRREADVMRAMLASFHEPLERPADWKDPYSRYR